MLVMSNLQPACAMLLPVGPPAGRVASSTPVPLASTKTDRSDILSTMLIAIARAAEDEGQSGQALDLYEKVWELRKVSGRATVNGAIAAGRLAFLYVRNNKLLLGETLAKQSLQDVKSIFGPSGEVTAIALNNLGTIEELLKHYTYAEQLFKQSIGAARADGESALETAAITETNLGDLYWKMKNINEALIQYSNALRDLRQFTSDKDPEIVKVQSRLDKIRRELHR